MLPGRRIAITTPATTRLPAGWTAYTDVKTSQTYYVHLPTGDTQWTRPPPPPPPPPRPPQPQPNVTPLSSTLHTVTIASPQTFQLQYRPSRSTANNLFDGGGSGSTTSRLCYYPNINQSTLPPLPHQTPSFNSISQLKRSQMSTQHASKPPTKRPRVQPTKSQANHITPESSNGNKWKVCIKCNLKREWHFFSKKQWQSGVSGKCKSCVDETVVDAIVKSRAGAKKPATSKLSSSATDDITNTTTEFFRVQPTPEVAKKTIAKNVSQLSIIDPIVRACSTCKKRGAKGFFSKRQWPSREDVRKCKSCMKKYVLAKSNYTSGNVLVKDASEGGDSLAMHGRRDKNTPQVNNSLTSSGTEAVPAGVPVKQEKIYS